MTERTTPGALSLCPFCGADDALLANEHRDKSGGWYVYCVKCQGSTGLRYSIGEDARPLVIEQWNRRAPAQPDKTLMRQALDALVLLDESFCADDYGTREGRIRGRKALTNSRAAVASLRAALSATQEKPHD